MLFIKIHIFIWTHNLYFKHFMRTWIEHIKKLYWTHYLLTYIEPAGVNTASCYGIKSNLMGFHWNVSNQFDPNLPMIWPFLTLDYCHAQGAVYILKAQHISDIYLSKCWLD